MVRVQRIPLFPLNLVLFPKMPLPLHIFELRYRRVIRRCTEEHEEFGVLLHTGKELTRVGCTARVEGVIREYGDGRFDILSLGHERFRVQRFFKDQSHLEAEVQFFQDDPVPPAELPRLQELSAEATRELTELAAMEDFSIDEKLLQSLNPEAVSLLICSTQLFPLEDKQILLESRDTKQRLEQAVARTGERIKQRRAEKKIEELLGGKLDFSSLIN
jgi:Lon protease-like protein